MPTLTLGISSCIFTFIVTSLILEIRENLKTVHKTFANRKIIYPLWMARIILTLLFTHRFLPVDS